MQPTITWNKGACTSSLHIARAYRMQLGELAADFKADVLHLYRTYRMQPQIKEQAVTLHLARVYKMQPTFIATIIIAMATLHLYRVYNMKH